MNSGATPSFIALAVAAITMAGELLWSRRNERRLLQRGAIEPPDPAYSTMRWGYPAVFVAMAAEGVLTGRATSASIVAGALLLVLAKALKYWAITSLGHFWTFRLIVVPRATLIASGPYRFLRHPNYVAVVGEIVAMALLTGALVTGPIGVLFFALLLRQRIRSEEAALGLP